MSQETSEVDVLGIEAKIPKPRAQLDLIPAETKKSVGGKYEDERKKG